MNELARTAARWAEQEVASGMTRRSLLLKLSAAFTVAAATPSIAGADPSETAVVPAGGPPVDLSGIWHSSYTYYSSSRDRSFTGEHYVVLRQQRDGRWIAQSLPHSIDSRLRLELAVRGAVATGTWTERTSPRGYYKGATYHGAIQLLIDPMGRRMTGKWVGFGKQFDINVGDWELRWCEGTTSKQTQRAYHFKA